MTRKMSLRMKAGVILLRLRAENAFLLPVEPTTMALMDAHKWGMNPKMCLKMKAPEQIMEAYQLLEDILAPPAEPRARTRWKKSLRKKGTLCALRNPQGSTLLFPWTTVAPMAVIKGDHQCPPQEPNTAMTTRYLPGRLHCKRGKQWTKAPTVTTLWTHVKPAFLGLPSARTTESMLARLA